MTPDQVAGTILLAIQLVLLMGALSGATMILTRSHAFFWLREGLFKYAAKRRKLQKGDWAFAASVLAECPMCAGFWIGLAGGAFLGPWGPHPGSWEPGVVLAWGRQVALVALFVSLISHVADGERSRHGVGGDRPAATSRAPTARPPKRTPDALESELEREWGNAGMGSTRRRSGRRRRGPGDQQG